MGLDAVDRADLGRELRADDGLLRARPSERPRLLLRPLPWVLLRPFGMGSGGIDGSGS